MASVGTERHGSCPGSGTLCEPPGVLMAAVGIRLVCVIMHMFLGCTGSGGLFPSEECLPS